tara:strand:- start:244 stop:363 length:120 start_codon:yes stop_codon:yes gene_type:complete
MKIPVAPKINIIPYYIFFEGVERVMEYEDNFLKIKSRRY